MRRADPRVQTITTFMLDLFEAGHPEETRGETITAPMLLERGVARAEQLAGQPVVEAGGAASAPRIPPPSALSAASRRSTRNGGRPDEARQYAGIQQDG